MNKKNIRKIYVYVANALVLSSFIFLSGHLQAEEILIKTDQIKKSTVENKNGLMGYYFIGKDFQNLVLISPCKNGEFQVTKEKVNQLLSTEKQRIQAARWVGYIKPSESGEYEFSTSSDEQVVLQIDKKIVMDVFDLKGKVKLEKDKLYEVRLEYIPEDKDIKDKLVNLQLFWSSNSIPKEVVPEQNLIAPDFSLTNKTKWIPEQNLISSNEPRDRVKRSLNEKLITKDTDGDSIPDDWEKEGYTIVNQNAVKWEEQMAENGYTKYVSNPDRQNTTGDPYTDFQKASGQIDPAIKEVAHNPLIAAYPRIGVQLENVVISKNNDITESQGGETSTSITKGTSNSKTNETSTGIDKSVNTTIEASMSPSLSVSVSVSKSFNESNSSTATIDESESNTSGTNWSRSIGLNTAQSAYLGARIRYLNTGTAPAYEVKPDVTLGIGKKYTFTSGIVADKYKANVLNPDAVFPPKESLPILLNKHVDAPISIDINQLNELQKIKKVRLDSTQYDALVGLIGPQAMQKWVKFTNDIEHMTARIIFVSPMGWIERRVAAPVKPNHPEDKYPKIKVDDALDIAVDGYKKTENGYQYNDYTFQSLHFIYDEATAEKFKEQAKKSNDGKLNPMDLQLNAKMNIQISPKGWVTNNKTNKKYYYNEKGIKVTGIQNIDNKLYEFDKNGVFLKEKEDVEYKINKDEFKATFIFPKAPSTWFNIKTMHNSNVETVTLQINDSNIYGFGKQDGRYNSELAVKKTEVGNEIESGWTLKDQTSKDGKYLFKFNHYYEDGTIKVYEYEYNENEKVIKPIKEGNIQRGWKTIDEKKYYYESGEMVKNLVKEFKTNKGIKKYYFDKDGVMRTNYWHKEVDGKTKVYFGSDGELIGMDASFHTIDGKTYYFKNSKMVIGWQKIGDKTYYFRRNREGILSFEEGKMVTGWQIIGGKKYYFGEKGDGIASLEIGEMATGWKTISGKRYYFGEKREGISSLEIGEMAKARVKIDGQEYIFVNGVLKGKVRKECNMYGCWNTDVRL
ncbi:binary toxin-like calcium binding domain-containing protein [Bacillus toyonensis]|uniref:binary toxin-like calcium binding domain-containing protein n=1 Tax=Bacillus toyonensis TaxID=155322 RepID=UPI003D1D6B34